MLSEQVDPHSDKGMELTYKMAQSFGLNLGTTLDVKDILKLRPLLDFDQDRDEQAQIEEFWMTDFEIDH